MRQSRKAGLLTSGVRWIKYNCSRYQVEDGYGVRQSGSSTIESGTDDMARYTGYSSYPRIAWSDFHGCYIYYQQGEIRDVSVHEPGTVYTCPDPECLWIITVLVSGDYTIKEQTIRTVVEYRDAYRIGQTAGLGCDLSGDRACAKL